MQTRYHTEITSQALGELISQQALQVIIQANLAQDNISGQIGHPEYHFDDNCFLEGNAYLREQRQHILKSLSEQAAFPAWQAFGRLIHAAQDFYAHSTYVRLWFNLPSHHDSTPMPDEIEPLEPGLIHHPALISGRIYLPWEILSFIPGLEKLMCILLPQDSHTNLNLDKPSRGQLFYFAHVAARKRTVHEYQQICHEIQSQLGMRAVSLFNGI